MADPDLIAARFWSKVDRRGPDECWPWLAAVSSKGYGRFWDPCSGLNMRTNRFAWEQAHGQIPTGLQVLHRCDNPTCVNPRHLFLGTNDDNVRDKVEKGRQIRGERNGKSVLREWQVAMIRESPLSGRVLARQFGVARTTIRLIRRGHTWRHVKPPAPSETEANSRFR